jgi:hypothetical protein
MVRKINQILRIEQMEKKQEMMMGVIAIKEIKKGIILGKYPGEIRNRESRLKKLSHLKPEQINKICSYDMLYPRNEEYVLVPVNKQGKILSKYKKNAMLYLNEPDPGKKENVKFYWDVPPDCDDVHVICTKNIMPGEELLIDYGPLYERTYETNKYRNTLLYIFILIVFSCSSSWQNQ